MKWWSARKQMRGDSLGSLVAVPFLLCALAQASISGAGQAPVNVVRPRIDLTQMTRATTVVPLALVTPAMAQNIGPGSHLLIEIPGAGTFGCTANFVWASGGTRYLGAAGHCFLPEGTTATHGPGANQSRALPLISRQSPRLVSSVFFGALCAP